MDAFHIPWQNALRHHERTFRGIAPWLSAHQPCHAYGALVHNEVVEFICPGSLGSEAGRPDGQCRVKFDETLRVYIGASEGKRYFTGFGCGFRVPSELSREFMRPLGIAGKKAP